MSYCAWLLLMMEWLEKYIRRCIRHKIFSFDSIVEFYYKLLIFNFSRNYMIEVMILFKTFITYFKLLTEKKTGAFVTQWQLILITIFNLLINFSKFMTKFMGLICVIYVLIINAYTTFYYEWNIFNYEEYVFELISFSI